MGLDIPLGNLLGRAGTGLPVGLRYSSKVWRIEYTFTHSTGGRPVTRTRAEFAEHSAAGWATSLSLPWVEFTGQGQFYDYNGEPKGNNTLNDPDPLAPRYYLARVDVHLPDGSSHELRKDYVARALTDGQEPDFSGTFHAADGSRLRYNHDLKTLYLPDGARHVLGDPDGSLEKARQAAPQTHYIDRHGNTLTYTYDPAADARWWTDTLGRVVALPLPRKPMAGDVTYSLPNAGGGAVSYTLRWRPLSEALTDTREPLRYRGSHRCGSTYTSVGEGKYLFGSFTPTYVCDGGVFNPVVLAEIVLPTGRQYRFTYNVYGEIERVSFPAGGSERFVYEEIPALSYSARPYRHAARGVVGRWVSASGGGGDEEAWRYGVETGPFGEPPYKAHTLAPDNTLSERVIRAGGGLGDSSPFGLDDPRVGMVQEERVYSAPGGALLRRSLSETAATFVDVTDEQGFTVAARGAARDPRVTKEVSLVLDTDGDALAQTTLYAHDANLNVTSVAAHDYAAVAQATAESGAIGAMPRGALLRTDETTYLVNDPAVAEATRDQYRQRNLLSLPTSTRVKNAAGTVVAQSEVRYDEVAYAPLACGATVGRSDPGAAVRGLATTTRRWLDAGNTWVETHAQYDACGSPRKSWDARGNVSEVEYSAD